MANVSKFIIDNTEIDVKDTTARNNIGTLSNLSTTSKSDLVSAINELVGEFYTITYTSGTESITITTPQ